MKRRGGVLRRHPARPVVFGFAVAIAVGTVLLSLGPATAGPGRAPVLTALFTSTSAVCVTGLVVVDTGAYWSGFGEGVILALVQIGGFGIMTGATVVALVVFRRIGLRRRMLAQAETGTLVLGDVRRIVRQVLVFTVIFEMAAAAVLAVRFAAGYGESPARALYLGVFHSVSAFNNAGFGLFPDNLVRFATDPWISGTILVALIAGGLGFPVLNELFGDRRAPRRWSLHTKITVGGTAVLLTGGVAAILALEWTNPATLGPLALPGKLLAGLFHSASPRTAGFNSLDVAGMREATWLATMVLMFIGGGSASTAGGIKVSTFFLLAYVIWAEMRGGSEVHAFGRRLTATAHRQALTVALLGVAAVVGGTFVLMASNPFPLAPASFEVISAFGTVGLSTGITADVDTLGRFLLVALMFVGRLGPATLGVALVLRERDLRYRYPEERPIIG